MRPNQLIISDRFCRWVATMFAAAVLLLLPPAPVEASLFHFSGPVPPDLGLRSGRLRPCPSASHCVREDWRVVDPSTALGALAPVINALPGTRIERQEGGPSTTYLHATAESRIFGFIDDLELAADPERGLLQVRSESRLGDSDLGVNRRRVEQLREALGLPQPR
jgi:uncharacterized protein (DUF1499 family)